VTVSSFPICLSPTSEVKGKKHACWPWPQHEAWHRVGTQQTFWVVSLKPVHTTLYMEDKLRLREVNLPPRLTHQQHLLSIFSF
jgi:hypothetical protein